MYFRQAGWLGQARQLGHRKASNALNELKMLEMHGSMRELFPSQQSDTKKTMITGETGSQPIGSPKASLANFVIGSIR